MKPGVLAVGTAAFFVAGSLLWLPLGAAARQTLLETGAATGVASDLNSRATVNSLAAMQRAKNVLGKVPAPYTGLDDDQNVGTASRRAGAGRRLAQPAASPAAPAAAAAPEPTLPAWDVIPVGLLADSKLLAQAKGRVVFMSGVIEAVEQYSGQTAYRMKPAPGSGLKESDRFVVQVPKGEASLGKAGEAARAFGSFVRVASSRKGIRVFTFSNGQMVSRVAPGETAKEKGGAGEAPAAVAFEDPLGGWKLEGTADGEGSGTAVFVSPEGRPYFLSVGQNFGNGFRVTGINRGEVKLSKAGSSFSVIAW